MISLVSAPAPNGTDLNLGGKKPEDLQKNVVLNSDGTISGYLKWVPDFDAFSSKPEEKKGNYLAMKFTNSGSDSTSASIVAEVIGPGLHSGPATLDEDGLYVVRVTNPGCKIKVKITGTDESVEERIYSMRGLQLEEETE